MGSVVAEQLSSSIFERHASKLNSRPIVELQLCSVCSWLMHASVVMATPHLELSAQMAVYSLLQPAIAGAVSAKSVALQPAGADMHVAAERDVAQFAAVVSELQAMPWYCLAQSASAVPPHLFASSQ